MSLCVRLTLIFHPSPFQWLILHAHCTHTHTHILTVFALILIQTFIRHDGYTNQQICVIPLIHPALPVNVL